MSLNVFSIHFDNITFIVFNIVSVSYISESTKILVVSVIVFPNVVVNISHSLFDK